MHPLDLAQILPSADIFFTQDYLFSDPLLDPNYHHIFPVYTCQFVIKTVSSFMENGG